MPPAQAIDYPSPTALYCHHKAIRTLLGVKPYTDAHTRQLAIGSAKTAATVVDTRSDIINITVDEIVRLGYELPVFRTIDEIAEQAYAAAELELHARIAKRLTEDQRKWLDSLLSAELPLRRTLYNKIKRSAKKTSRKHLDAVLDQLDWLESLPDSDVLLDGVPTTKLKHIADMASALDAGDMKDFTPAKRHTIILALIRQMRVSARDDIAEMFIRRVGTMHKSAREELQSIQARQREMSEELVQVGDGRSRPHVERRNGAGHNLLCDVLIPILDRLHEDGFCLLIQQATSAKIRVPGRQPQILFTAFSAHLHRSILAGQSGDAGLWKYVLVDRQLVRVAFLRLWIAHQAPGAADSSDESPSAAAASSRSAGGASSMAVSVPLKVWQAWSKVGWKLREATASNCCFS